jgi:hypothetical protein
VIGNLSDRALLFLIGKSDRQNSISDRTSIGEISPQEKIKKLLK